jgi:hypothetical protein
MMYSLRKKITVSIIILTILSILPLSAQDASQSARFESKIKELESRIARLEQRAGIEEPRKAPIGRSPVSIALLDKKFKKGDVSLGDTTDEITFTLLLMNNSGRDVKGFSGDVALKDNYNKDIAAFSMNADRFIRAGDAINWYGGIDFIKKNEGHRMLLQIDKQYLSAELKLQKVWYADGTSETFDQRR